MDTKELARVIVDSGNSAEVKNFISTVKSRRAFRAGGRMNCFAPGGGMNTGMDNGGGDLVSPDNIPADSTQTQFYPDNGVVFGYNQNGVSGIPLEPSAGSGFPYIERNDSLKMKAGMSVPELLYANFPQQKTREEIDRETAIELALNRVKREENSKLNLKGGYNPFKRTWEPHGSREGGAQTIGYGHKLVDENNKWTKLVNEREELSDEEVEMMAYDDVVDHYNKTLNAVDAKYGEGTFESLDPRVRSILTDYTYTGTGILKFPSFFDAMIKGDYKKAQKEYVRKSQGKPLGRNKEIKKELREIFEGK